MTLSVGIYQNKRACHLRAEKLGTAFAMVRMDVNGNITRLKDCQAVDPAKYAELFPIALDEVASGEACGSRSATKGILWLKR